MVVKNDYGKDYMKIKFNSNDDLPLNKLLKFRLMTRYNYVGVLGI